MIWLWVVEMGLFSSEIVSTIGTGTRVGGHAKATIRI